MQKICSFFGHRKIKDTISLRNRVKNAIVNLIEHFGVSVFLFGSRSEFDTLCHEIVTDLRDEPRAPLRHANHRLNGLCKEPKKRRRAFTPGTGKGVPKGICLPMPW